MRYGKKIISLTGQTIGLAYICIVGAFIIGEGLPDLVKGFSLLLSSFLMLFLCGAIGFIIAYRHPVTGAILQIGSGISITVYFTIIGNSHDMAKALLLSLPFVFSGIARIYSTKLKTD